MIQIKIPGRRNYLLKYLILDLNGTIVCDGILIEGVKERIEKLSTLINIYIITADTRGKARELENILHIRIHKISPDNEQEQKLNFIQKLGNQNTVSIGNGYNDALMLKGSRLGICVTGQEGASTDAIKNSDIIVPDINSALDLLIKPQRLIATLRK